MGKVEIKGNVTGSNVQIITDGGSTTINGREIESGTYEWNGSAVTVDNSRGSAKRR